MLLNELFLNELKFGGELTSDTLDSLKAQEKPMKQMDLFPDIPSLDHDNLPRAQKQVGRIAQYMVAMDYNNPSYIKFILYDKEKVIGYVDGKEAKFHAIDNRFKGFQVNGVEVDPSYQGQGLALRLYLWIVQNKYDYILPDDTHTRWGAKLWKKMNNSRKFDLVVFDDRKYDYRKRWSGKDLNHIYDYDDNLQPVLTVKGKAQQLFHDE